MATNDRQAFDTHFNYISALATLVRGVTLSYLPACDKKAIPLEATKDNLIKLTTKSLADERAIVEADHDFSYASTSWLPVKSYYLLFNILASLEYLITVQASSLNIPHIKCIECFTTRLSTGDIVFSEALLNTVFDHTILTLTEVAGANLSSRVGLERMYRMAMRKAARYKVDDWKRKKKINGRTTAGKQALASYLATFTISIFEFPYYMRIRANYRDFAFIEGIDASETADYFRQYYAFTRDFSRALQGMRTHLRTARTR